VTVEARSFYPWLAVAGLVLLVTAVALAGQAGSHGAPPTPRPSSSGSGYYPPTGFGGYHWHGAQIAQISADWQVPTPSTDQPFATASTWIGLQDAGYGPFIQVGATETAYAGHGHRNRCALFWSDTQRQFHPQDFSDIRCGDAVAASMTRGSRGWTLRIRDTTEGTAYAVTIPHSEHVRFTVGEWLQEDPSAGLATGADLPYPTTTPVTLSHLLVNGAIPTLGRSDGIVLASPNGIFQVPTPESDDGFSLADPQGEALQYLHGANLVDAAANEFSQAMTQWSGLSQNERRTIVTAYIHALRVGNRMILSLSLPPGQTRYLASFASENDRLEGKLSAWRSQGLQLSDSAYREAFDPQDARLYEDDVTMVRQAVGLPPL
jgi:hypothetical protein